MAWYVIAVVETCVNIAVSSKWKVVSFKGTHLVQRMSLLTLIICKSRRHPSRCREELTKYNIVGEGIIVICKSISKVRFLYYAS